MRQRKKRDYRRGRPFFIRRVCYIRRDITKKKASRHPEKMMDGPQTRAPFSRAQRTSSDAFSMFPEINSRDLCFFPRFIFFVVSGCFPFCAALCGAENKRPSVQITITFTARSRGTPSENSAKCFIVCFWCVVGERKKADDSFFCLRS